MSLDVMTASRGALAVTMRQYADFTEAWLANRRISDNTRDAYRRDVASWLAWCEVKGIEPRDAKFTHVNDYARELEKTIVPRTGKPMAATTVTRKLSGASSWYDYLVKMDVIASNPAARADRPVIDRTYSPTIGFGETETDRTIATAKLDSPLTHAIIILLADMGLRVSAVVGLDTEDVTWSDQRLSITYKIKGGEHRRREVPASAAEALYAHLVTLAESAGTHVMDLPPGALFTNPRTGRRMTRYAVSNLVKKVTGGAGLHSAGKLSPHSFRHGYVTNALRLGVAVELVQKAADHRSIASTLRYNHFVADLAKDPGTLLAAERLKRSVELAS